ncbi:MAG: fimbrial protein, partial [Prevotellaceae bacterium]|nr:fimbrial protein [Prevotellaceae bacterium]
MEVKRKSLNYRRDKWLCMALAALPLLASSLLLSCKDGEEEIASSNGDGEASVSVHISVGEIGDLNATRANTNVSSAPEDGELINTLCVFIVDSNNKIEMKIQPDLSGTEADGGNLEEYRSDIEILSAGTKTIYAFANWDNVGSENWDKLMAKEEGGNISNEDLQFLVDDPASKVDIANHKYIPMSGKATVTVTENYSYTQTISVKLTRLVGKVWAKVKLYEDNYSSTTNEVTVTGFTFSGTADNVWLFDDITGKGTITLDKEIKIESSDIMATEAIAEGETAD